MSSLQPRVEDSLSEEEGEDHYKIPRDVVSEAFSLPPLDPSLITFFHPLPPSLSPLSLPFLPLPPSPPSPSFPGSLSPFSLPFPPPSLSPFSLPLPPPSLSPFSLPLPLPLSLPPSPPPSLPLSLPLSVLQLRAYRSDSDDNQEIYNVPRSVVSAMIYKEIHQKLLHVGSSGSS